MADREATGGKMTMIEPGIISRVVTGIKYVISGVGPQDWFGPSQPPSPVAQEEAQGRALDYPTGYNLSITPRSYEPVSFQQMRALADGYDLLRLVIETRKDQLSKLQWKIKVRDINGKPTKEQGEAALPKINAVREFLNFPDREHTWSTWLRMLVEDMLVIDAATIYPRQTNGKKLYALEVIAGETIKRLLDANGRTPLPPSPAYQQVLKGLPAVDYSRDALVYAPRNPRSWKVYGYSPVEQIIMTVNIALRRQIYTLNYYTEGNVPEAMCGVPETWTPDQIKAFQLWWDDLMEGNLAARRHMKFVPSGVDIKETKPNALKDEMDEWLARIVCYAFSVSPQPFIKEMNRATAQSNQEAALQEGLAPLQLWIKSVMDMIIWKYLDAIDLEFSWEDEQAVKPLEQAQIDDLYIRNGTFAIDEVRDKMGKEPIGMPNAVFAAIGPVLIKDILNPPELEPDPEPIPGEEGQSPEKGAVPKGEEAAPVPGDDKPVEKLAKSKKKVKTINRNRKTITRARVEFKNKLLDVFETGKQQAGKLAELLEKRDLETDARVTQILSQLDLEGWAVIMDISDGVLAEVTKDGVYRALLQIGLKDDEMTAGLMERAVAYARERSAELVGKKVLADGTIIDNPNTAWNILETTREMLRADVTTAVNEGWSTQMLADKLEENYAFSQERAEMIARTEIAYADVQGNMITYRESGLVEGKEWILGSEHEDDDDCDMNAEAGVIPLDEPFPSGDMEPPLHPNCICDILPVLYEEAEA